MVGYNSLHLVIEMTGSPLQIEDTQVGYRVSAGSMIDEVKSQASVQIAMALS